MSSESPQVAIVMGSDSDWPKIKKAAAALDEFSVAYEVRVMSAHRTPLAVAEYATTAVERGLQVIIAAAGGAAHLAGVIAAHTTLPVIGLPVPTPDLGGLDSLLSTVQMPGDVPVACVHRRTVHTKRRTTSSLGMSLFTDRPVARPTLMGLPANDLRFAIPLRMLLSKGSAIMDVST